MNKSLEYQFKQQLASYLDTTAEHIYLYYKGRVALYAILQAMQVGKGDEVILPAFTCVVVSNAIKYLGATPVYTDIDPDTYNADIAGIEKAISPRTKVIICQNTFGLSSNVDAIHRLARQHHIYTIEDCTHGFGGTYKGKPNGTYCDAAFYSTQWNKPFSTGVGGFAFIQNEMLEQNLAAINSRLERPSVKNTLSLGMLYFVREKLLSDKCYWHMISLYRWLSKHQLVQGSSSGIELCSLTQPQHYFKAMSAIQMKKGLQNIKKLPYMMQLRKHNARLYNDYLLKHNKTFVNPQLFPDHAFLKYPVLVWQKDKVLTLAEKQHIPLGEWFCSPIHPVRENWETWNLHAKDFPVAMEKSQQILNLPTDEKNIEKILQFLDNINEFLV